MNKNSLIETMMKKVPLVFWRSMLEFEKYQGFPHFFWVLVHRLSNSRKKFQRKFVKPSVGGESAFKTLKENSLVVSKEKDFMEKD